MYASSSGFLSDFPLSSAFVRLVGFVSCGTNSKSIIDDRTRAAADKVFCLLLQNVFIIIVFRSLRNSQFSLISSLWSDYFQFSLSSFAHITHRNDARRWARERAFCQFCLLLLLLSGTGREMLLRLARNSIFNVHCAPPMIFLINFHPAMKWKLI